MVNTIKDGKNIIIFFFRIRKAISYKKKWILFIYKI
jgi:hypothetical protein